MRCLIVTLMMLAIMAFPVVSLAPACLGTDDTAFIQSFIDSGTQMSAGRCVVGPLNVTNRVAPMVVGRGVGVTLLLPRDAHSVVLDLTGSSFPEVRNLQIGDQSWPVVAQVGILMAQAHGNSAANRHVLTNVQVTGWYEGAAIYNYGVASSTIIASAFWNFQPNAPTAIWTSDNNWAIQSPFALISNALEYATDWTFLGVEFHHDLLASGPSNQPTFVCRGCSSIRHIGGTIAGSGPMLVMFLDMAGAANAWLTYVGVGFYSDNGTPPGAIFGGGQRAAVSLTNCSLVAPTGL